ncbi:unnamed protein product [Sphenostylis stenocarpa]|uniref:Uncharacterized protein n=1 Tax=Sphenostylis stenocarpa TaxID=92480 RepID=A0AA86TBY2_9FABA|nr:unnamed protein product [Sphenostylis stenocarpa]
MVCQAASKTRFRALKHENGIEGEPTIIIRVIACFQPLHDCQAEYFRHLLKPINSKSLKIPYQDLLAHWSWPYPQQVAWPSPYLNSSCTLAETSSCVHSSYMNSSTSVFPAVSLFPRFTAPAIPNLNTDQTNEVQGFLQHPISEPCLNETHTGGAMQSESLQKKLLIFDHSGSKTRLLYSPVFPFVQSPIVTATQFTQVYDVNEEAQEINMGLKHWPIYTSPQKTGKDHIDNEESEMHEDTEEINALLYSDDDDDDDEVTSTGHSPLLTEKTCLTQEQCGNTKEEVATSDWPNKRQKLIDGGFNRLPPLVDGASSERLNKMCYAESNYASSGAVYASRQTEEDKSTASDIQLKKDKIRELLRLLENFIPGAKGEHPLLVIDGTIEYLESLMSQTAIKGAKAAIDSTTLFHYNMGFGLYTYHASVDYKVPRKFDVGACLSEELVFHHDLLGPFLGYTQNVVVKVSLFYMLRVESQKEVSHEQWSRAVQAVVTGCTGDGHGLYMQWSRLHAANFTWSQLIEVGSSPAATLVGTFVFGILSEEHRRYGSVSSRHDSKDYRPFVNTRSLLDLKVLPRNRVAGLKTRYKYYDNTYI